MQNKTMILLAAALLAVIFFLYILEKFFSSFGAKVEVTNPPHEPKPLMPWVLGFAFLLFSGYYLLSHPEKLHDLRVDLLSVSMNSSAEPREYLDAGSGRRSGLGAGYDTDPSNNRYIIGGLKAQQLKKLDRVLEFDKRNGYLNETTLERLADSDEDVVQAYYRFLKCKNLMRSTNTVIYPDER
ncbi:MAG TPA: hypothetical protein PK843_10115 [bacterium]|nr:hypothetical protein [bacterium]HPN34860.1 hypothetical protein [bacterium]